MCGIGASVRKNTFNIYCKFKAPAHPVENTCGITYSNTMFHSVEVEMVFVICYFNSGPLQCHLATLSRSRITEVILKLIHTMRVGDYPITNDNRYPVSFKYRKKNRK